MPPLSVMNAQPMLGFDPFEPVTAVLQNALPRIRDRSAQADLLFLERWEMAPQSGTALALRVQQIRRANPELAEAIRAEVARRRPMSPIPG